jgi:hypothetical protein
MNQGMNMERTWCGNDKGKQALGEKIYPTTTFYPETPHGLTWD